MEQKTVHGWIARDKDNSLQLYNYKPSKSIIFSIWWRGERDDGAFTVDLPDNSFPQVRWEDKEPSEVILTITINGK